MSRHLLFTGLISFSLTGLLTFAGCGEENANEVAVAGAGAMGNGARPEPASNPKLKSIMTKIGKGPQSLQESLKTDLKQEPVSWDTIEPKAKEYASVASEIGQQDPPRGQKDSWQKLSQVFADSASELSKAAQANNRDDTLAALDNLGGSCMSCHRQHRMMGRGGPPGGMGFPPGGPGMPRGGPGMPPGGPQSK
jgi:cytochrome c556